MGCLQASSGASSGGLLGRVKALFNLSEASNPQNPSPTDVSKDIANRLGGGGGISAINQQSPGALTAGSLLSLQMAKQVCIRAKAWLTPFLSGRAYVCVDVVLLCGCAYGDAGSLRMHVNIPPSTRD